MSAPLDPQYIDQIKGFEGYSAQPAWDYKQSSSGYGTKAQPGDADIPPDQLKAVHEQRLNDEIAKAAAHVDKVNPDLPPGARAALISLTYNAGPGWANSGLGDLVRNGDLAGAQQRLLEYNKAGGKVLPALERRRTQEASWFNTPAQPTQTAAAPPMQPATPAANPMTPPQQPGPPLSLAPPQAPPIFAQQPQAPQAAPQQMADAMPPAMGMQPIFAAKPKQVDISRLRAALAASQQRAPIFGQG